MFSPQTYRLKLIRIVPLQSVGSSSAADRVRFLAPGTAANGPRLSKWVDTPLLKYERSNTGQLNNSKRTQAVPLEFFLSQHTHLALESDHGIAGKEFLFQPRQQSVCDCR